MHGAARVIKPETYQIERLRAAGGKACEDQHTHEYAERFASADEKVPIL